MVRFFTNEDEARDYMRSLNRTHMKEIFCFVDGPEDNFDLETAIDLETLMNPSTR